MIFCSEVEKPYYTTSIHYLWFPYDAPWGGNDIEIESCTLSNSAYLLSRPTKYSTMFAISFQTDQNLWLKYKYFNIGIISLI